MKQSILDVVNVVANDKWQQENKKINKGYFGHRGEGILIINFVHLGIPFSHESRLQAIWIKFY